MHVTVIRRGRSGEEGKEWRGVKRTTEFVQNNRNLRHWLVKESDRLFHTEKRAKIKLIYSKY